MAEVGSLPDLPLDGVVIELQEMKQRIEEILEALNEEVAEKIGSPWRVDPTYGDLLPDEFANETPGIGNVDNPVNHVAVGLVKPFGLEGFMIHRDEAEGGGLMLAGLRNQDPVVDPTPNAIVEVRTIGFVVRDGTIWVQVPEPTTEDKYVIALPSQTDSQGDHFVPLALGPVVVYQDEQRAVPNPADYDVTNTTVTVNSMVMDRNLAAGSTRIGYEVTLAEFRGRDVIFTVEIRVNSVVVPAGTLNPTLSGSPGQVFVNEVDYTAGLVIGDTLDVRVTGVGTHPQSDGWVMGSVNPTELYAKQQ